MQTQFDTIICRYSEIALKGRNRSDFESRLVDNIACLLDVVPGLEISRTRGRVIIGRKTPRPFDGQEICEIKNGLSRAFGLASFSFAVTAKAEIEDILRAVRLCSHEPFVSSLEGEGKVSFRVRTRRADKGFPMKSKEVEIAIAKLVGALYDPDGRLVVDLDNADITIGCEIRKKAAYVFLDSIPGPGGLPVGCSSPVLALISGGIDSPVACRLMMKRGCHVDYMAFHSAPYTPPETVGKVERLIEVLDRCQHPGRLFVCNLAPIQKVVRDSCSERFRTVLFRRIMFRIAGAIAKRNSNGALVTGESVGQVASQTISNMACIDAAAGMLVLRPLCGMDKEEVIKIARAAGTFDISAEQVPDSCTVFAPSSPATSAPTDRILKEESRINIADLFDKAVSEAWENSRMI
ncbi:MAG: tRNA 4-thiouridine(8) synthase ThiI [Victivallales bacterium]|nr:tRNA 4-thiouridine(8) synthase ThiI [Victivallales bacterium]